MALQKTAKCYCFKIPISRKDDIVVQEVDGEVLIYDLKKDKAFCLNKTSALVWQACDGKRTITDISNWLGQQLNSQTDEDVVWIALDQLTEENLLEKDIHIETNGLSRREVIKKIGMTSMVALPLVAMLSFPQRAVAQTCSASICEGNASGLCGQGQRCCRGTCQQGPCVPAC